jgi:ParB family chromosome partitioning protein
LEAIKGAVRYPEAIPRALGLDLYKLIMGRPDLAKDIADRLNGHPERDKNAELGMLREALIVPKKRGSKGGKSVSKTSLRTGRPEGEARVTALDGKVELRLERDFSAIPKARLQQGIEAFLAALDANE